MKDTSFPVPLARLGLSLAPSFVVSRFTEVALARMERRHPKLFKNLARLQPALVHLAPSDLPHRFAIVLGREPVRFYLVEDRGEKPDACISGPLESMIDMLEGRQDGDALFFSREIQVTGDTTIIVGLRNTLDREEIDLYQEILGLFGPFSGAVAKGVSCLDFAARRAKARLAALHDEMHKTKEEEGEA